MKTAEASPMESVSAISLQQTEKGTFRGVLEVTSASGGQGRELPVTVIHDPGERVWIRVRVKNAVTDKEDRKRISHQLASNALSLGGGWRYLAADWRDGEILFSATVSCDLSGEAVDRFLDTAKEFLSKNWAELSELIEGPRKQPPTESGPRSQELDWTDLI